MEDTKIKKTLISVYNLEEKKDDCKKEKLAIDPIEVIKNTRNQSSKEQKKLLKKSQLDAQAVRNFWSNNGKPLFRDRTASSCCGGIVGCAAGNCSKASNYD